MDERLDKLLIQKQLVSSRVIAEKLIIQTGVLVNGKLVTKPGKKIPIDSCIELLINDQFNWISSKALMLLKALDFWSIDVQSKKVIDVGASLGGFTEVLLNKGASLVYAVDAGFNLLHPTLKENEKVVDLDQTQVRELTSQLILDPVDLIVISLTAISLEKVFPFLHLFLKEHGNVIAVIKPQFEAEKKQVPKSGVIKDQSVYSEVISNVKQFGKASNFDYIQHIDAPFLGEDGNKEFLMLFKKYQH